MMSDADKQLKQQPEDKLKLDFVGLVSHELRMPISAIVGYLELLLDHTYGPLTEEQEKTLGYMSQNARDLLRMVNDLLQLTNLQAGRAQLVLESVDAGELARSVLKHLAPLHRDKRLEVTASFPDDLPPLRTDSTKLRQIIINLVSNAVKFTNEGSVTLTGRIIPSPAGDAARWFEIEVRDTGIGISGEKLDKTFKMFSQLDTRVAREFEGMGLGLYISQYLARILGGSISVTSEVGKGSCFVVRLPQQLESVAAVKRLGQLSKAAASTVEIPAEAQAASVKPGERCVLVVGRDPDLARLLGDSLRKEGFRALKATSAKAALKAVAEAKPEALFVDLTQNQSETWNLLQQIKAESGLADLPLIYLTDYSEAPPSVDGAQAPLTVTTPVKPQDIVQSVRKAGNKDKKVLVADDDEWIRVLLETVLKDEGYQVLLAKDGREAVQQLEQTKPDLLMLDLNMPEMTGWEVIHHIYGNRALRHTRVVIVTGQMLSQDDTKMISQNIQGFISKSEFKIEKILAEVRKVMQNP